MVIMGIMSNSSHFKEIFAICYGILFTVIVGEIEYYRIFLNKKKFEYLDFFLVALALFNGFGYAFVFWGTGKGLNIPIWTTRIESYDAVSISIYFALNIILLTTVIVGWTVCCQLNGKAQAVKYDEEKSFYSSIEKAAWILLAIAVGAYLLYSRAYGGFGGLLKYSKLIRSGIVTVYNPFSFLQRFGAFSLFSSFLFFSMLIDKSLKMIRRKTGIIGFLVSFGFSFFVLYSWEGRIAFIVYLLTFILAMIIYRNNSIIRLIRKFSKVLILAFLLIIAVDRLLTRTPVEVSVTGLFVKELSFPSAAFITQLDSETYRWFKDIFIAPVYLLPYTIWRYKLGLDTASIVVTYNFWGAYKGEAGVTGSIPVDLLTFSYMQAHIAGVIIVGFFTGAGLYGMQKLQNSIPIDSLRAVIGSNIILNVIILTVPYGEPYHIITRCFYLIGGLIILKFIFGRHKIIN